MAMGTVTVMHVSADKETCAVSDMCAYRVPQVFDQNEEGIVKVIDRDPPSELHKAVRRAACDCPTRSIHVAEVCS